MRYMAKVMKDALHDKFPEAREKDVLKVWMALRQLLQTSSMR